MIFFDHLLVLAVCENQQGVVLLVGDDLGVGAEATAAGEASRGEAAESGGDRATPSDGRAATSAQFAEGRGHVRGLSVLDRDDLRFDLQRRGDVYFFDHFHHPVHVFGVVPQDNGLGAGKGDNGLLHFGERGEHIGQIFDVGVFGLNDLCHQLAGCGRIVGIGGNQAARPWRGGLPDNLGELVADGDNGDAVHAQDGFQRDNRVRAGDWAFGFQGDSGVFWHRRRAGRGVEKGLSD